MIDGQMLKRVALKRVEAAKVLQSAGDWDGAGHMLGLALECALKSACCKSLRLAEYPGARNSRPGDSDFRTHSFERLLTISGCEDLFLSDGIGLFAWFEFVGPFADVKGSEGKGKWIEQRYEDGTFSEVTVAILLSCLEGREAGREGIFTLLDLKQRW